MIDSKFKKYIIYTNLFYQVIILTIIGYYIGYKINNENNTPAVFAVIGLVMGIINFVYIAIRLEKKNDRKKGL